MRVSPAGGSSERRAAGEALVLAFEHDRGWSALLPDPNARRAVLGALLRALLTDRAPGQTVLVARAGDALLGAVVAWAPGHHPGVVGTLRYAPAAAAMLSLAPRATLRAWRRSRAMRAADGRQPAHWHLALIGVRPEAQRRGVGRALLDAFLGLSGEEGAPAYLETSRPELLDWYRESGFEVCETLEPGVGAPLWTMRRAASAHALGE